MLPPPHEWLPSPSTSSYHTYVIAALVRAHVTKICMVRFLVEVPIQSHYLPTSIRSFISLMGGVSRRPHLAFL